MDGVSSMGMSQSLLPSPTARLAQSVERKALNLVVVGSSPTVGDACCPCHLSILPCACDTRAESHLRHTWPSPLGLMDKASDF